MASSSSQHGLLSFPSCECPSSSSSSSSSASVSDEGASSSSLSRPSVLSETFSSEVVEEIEALQAIYGEEHVKVFPCCRLVQIRTETMRCMPRQVDQADRHSRAEGKSKTRVGAGAEREEEGEEETLYVPIYFIVQLYLPLSYKQDVPASRWTDEATGANGESESQDSPVCCLVHLPWAASSTSPDEDRGMQAEILKLQKNSSTSLFEYVECVRNFLPLPPLEVDDVVLGERRSGERDGFLSGNGPSEPASRSSFHGLSSTRLSSGDAQWKREAKGREEEQEGQREQRSDQNPRHKDDCSPHTAQCSSVYDESDEDCSSANIAKKTRGLATIHRASETSSSSSSSASSYSEENSSSCLSEYSNSGVGIELFVGSVVTVQKSRFIGICASVHTPHEVREVYRHIKETQPGATHYIMAYALRYRQERRVLSQQNGTHFLSAKSKRKDRSTALHSNREAENLCGATSRPPAPSKPRPPSHSKHPRQAEWKGDKKDNENSDTRAWIENCDHDSDGEAGAGKKLQQLLWNLKVFNVLVIVIRYYGGIHLGPDRFRVIASVARDVLEENGFLSATPSHPKTSQKGHSKK